MAIKINDYILYKKIGKGSFGEVFLTKKENDPKIYATKRINVSLLKSTDVNRYLNNEISIMKQLDHENVIKLHEKLETVHNKYLIMEHINGGSLADFLSEYKLKNGSRYIKRKSI